MRIWDWQLSGPEEPHPQYHRDKVWDEEDLIWERKEDGRWWPPGDPDKCPEDLYGSPLPWSVLLEIRGPLRNGPREGVQMPGTSTAAKG